jgi:penicillin amidase
MDFDENVFPYRVKSGPAMRIVIDMGDMENSISINPTGQSGHMMSAHYQDQAEMYNLGQFRPQHMDRKKILEEAKGVLRLQPSYPE